MKNILIIRSANGIIIEKTIKYICEKYRNEICDIYMLIQENSLVQFQEKYPYISYLVFPNTNFNYHKLKKYIKNDKILNTKKFDEVYIPSSTEAFNEFEEIFLIVSKIKHKSCLLFNNMCFIEKIKLSFIGIVLKIKYRMFKYIVKLLVGVILIIITYIIYYPYYKFKVIFKNFN